MGGKRFDRKFGADFLRELPEAPAVYLFKDETGVVLYAGKAKNVRRRLSSYRNASRRKAHRKMRAVVREAHSVEVRVQPSEGDALLVENELIRTLRPRFNVDGAFDFLYPAIGTGQRDGLLLLCLSTRPEAYDEFGLRWHGTYRPRLRACEAFDGLVDLFARIGHLEPRTRTPKAPRLRGSRLVALRRVPPGLLEALRDFLDGESDVLLASLCEHLLESRAARSEAGDVQATLRLLAAFQRRDVRRLHDALRIAGRGERFVPQAERDALFIEARLRSGGGGDSPQAAGGRRSASRRGRTTSGKVDVARDAKVASPVRTMK